MLNKKNPRKRMAAMLFSAALIAAACGSETVESEAVDVPDVMDDDVMDDDGATPAVSFSFDGLEPLGEGFVYEGWAIVDGSPVSTGRFTLDPDGTQHFHTGSLIEDASAATAVVLTIEPGEGDDPAPADAHVLAGDIVDGVAQLSIGHPAALGEDFTGASGQFVLATPTTTADDDELSGIWFIDIVDGAATQGLSLPELPAGWIYEGWAVIEGQPVSTGRFTNAGAADDFDGFSGTEASGPGFPGEDFILNAPGGLDFPTVLTGSTVVISVEPRDDDSPAPFAFKPLASEVPAGTSDHVGVALGAGPEFPSGVATITS